MPASHTIDVQQRLVRSRAWGALSEADLIAHYRAIREDPRFDPTFSQLGDLREVSEFLMSSTAIRREAGVHVFDRHARRALVASSDIAFGLSRMYATEAEGATQFVQVFRDMAEAEEWLAQTAP